MPASPDPVVKNQPVSTPEARPPGTAPAAQQASAQQPAARPEGGPARIAYADAMRFIAIAAVVFVHGKTIPAENLALGSLAWWVPNLVSSAVRWCVPVFFMLSGALLLDPARRESAAAFFRRRLSRLGLPVLFWTAVYLVWYDLTGVFDVSLTLAAGAVIRGMSSGHLWFVYALIGLYAVTPALRWFIGRSTTHERAQTAWWMLGVSSFSVVLWAALGEIDWRIPPNSVFTVTWLPYIGYFLAGHVLASVTLSRRQMVQAAAVWLAMTAIVAAGYYLSRTHGATLEGQALFRGYLSPPAVVMSIAAFLLIANLFRKAPRPGLAWAQAPLLGTLSFGVYLIHIIVRDVMLYAGWRQLVPDPVLSYLGGSLVVLALSYLAAWVLHKLPLVRRLVGA